MGLKIPDILKEKFNLTKLKLLPFSSSPVILKLNFSTWSKPELITELFYYCLRDEEGNTLDIQFIWELPVSKRIEYLTFLALSEHNGKIEISLKCKNALCLHEIGFYISQHDIQKLLKRLSNFEKRTINLFGEKIILKKPTGLDQLKWFKKSYNDYKEAIRDVVLSLITNKDQINIDEITNNLLTSKRKISTIMEKVDPLITCKMPILCPYCGKTGDYSINLEQYALNSLYKKQKEVLNSIHLIACNYHWNEEDIVSLPNWRRYYYLRLLKER